MARQLSKRARTLLDAYAHEVSDHREWNNEHNVKRSRAELVAYILKLENAAARYVQAATRTESWRGKLRRR